MSEDARPPRHAGRIEDPSVLEEGETEPRFDPSASLHAERLDESTTNDPEPSAAPSEGTTAEPDTAAETATVAGDETASKADTAAGTGAIAETKATAAAPEAIAEPEVVSEPEAATSSPSKEHPQTERDDAESLAPVVNGEPAAFDEQEDDEPPPAAFVRTGHPVRDRLLAKAAQAQREARPAPAPNEPFRSLGAMEEELAEIAESGGPNSTEPVRIAGTALSSNTVLAFGTLFGLAAFALLFSLLIQFAPRDTEELPTSSTPAAFAPVAPDPAVPEAVDSTEPGPPAREKIPGPWRIEQAAAGERILRGTIGREPFLRAIQSAGLDKTQAYRVYKALKDEKNLDRCRPRDEFVALLGRSDGRVRAFEYIVDKEEVYQAKEGKDGLLQGKRLDLKVEKGRVQGALRIASSSFADAAREADFDPSIGRVLNRALDGHTSVEEFQVGDRLRVVALEVTVLGEFHRYAGIEALEYLPVSGTPLRIYYLPNRKRYYDSRGRAPGEAGWRRPVKGAPITSKFNPNRLHPILKKRMPHNGTDFGAPTGTPVMASSSGTITKRGNYGPNGNFIAIEHRGGYETGYSHLSRFEPDLNVGDRVARLQVIGYVGSTGRSTGPHLHFSAKKDGEFIDPESLGLDALTRLPRADLELLKKVREKYDPLLEEIPLPAAPQGAKLAAAEPALAPIPDTLPEEGSDEAPALQPFIPAQPLPAAPPARVQPVQAIATPAPDQPAPAQPDPRRATSGSFSLYLSDKELMEAQSPTDDGEVEE